MAIIVQVGEQATPLSDMVGGVAPEVRGCPVQLVQQAICNAAIEFCERTKSIQFDHSPINSVAEEGSYALDPPVQTVVSQIMEAWYDGVKITPKTPDEISRLIADWRNATGTPLYYTQLSQRSIELAPAPETAVLSAIVMRVVLKPTPTATALYTRIVEEYSEIISYGAKYRLFAMGNQVWSNPSLADANWEMFTVGIGKENAKAARGYVRSKIRTTPQYF